MAIEDVKKSLFEYIDSFDDLIGLVIMNNFSMPVMSDYLTKSFVEVCGLRASSITLKGIKSLIEIGDYADCYLLIRRIRDNIILDSYLAYDAEKNHASINDDIELTSEGIERFITKLISENIAFEQNDPSKKSIRRWKQNKVEKEKWIGYDRLKTKLAEDALFQELFDIHLKEDLSEMQQITNRYAHALTSETLFNFTCDPYKEMGQIFDLIIILKELLISNFMLIKSRIFSSDEYMDALEAGLKPEEGSQYWLAFIVQDAVWEIKGRNEALFSFLKENNSDSMEFLDLRR